MLVFKEMGKPGYLEKLPFGSKGEKQEENQPTHGFDAGF